MAFGFSCGFGGKIKFVRDHVIFYRGVTIKMAILVLYLVWFMIVKLYYKIQNLIDKLETLIIFGLKKNSYLDY